MFSEFVSPAVRQYLLAKATPADGAPDLLQVGKAEHEDPAALKLVQDLCARVFPTLETVHANRANDRKFIDDQTKALVKFNAEFKREFSEESYKTVIGMCDSTGRVVVGPLGDHYVAKGSTPIAPLPPHLVGKHVTLFGPPDTAQNAVETMNSCHRVLVDEADIVKTLVESATFDPFWGADHEDSKVPLRNDILSATKNLTACFDGSITATDASGATQALEKTRLAKPLKRLPGVSIPCMFLFYAPGGDASKAVPVPLHVYDFALQFTANWQRKEALTFYIPKMENEEEAAYWGLLFRTAEETIRATHPEYTIGTIRAMCVLENPRVIYRAHEVMDALYPYFAGASLGWHDYLASTARMFKEDPNYRIPVKADPYIVIKYVKASHDLLSNAVGSRGGIKIGGMYGVLPRQSLEAKQGPDGRCVSPDPVAGELNTRSYQVTLRGYFKDLITQLRRGLDGFWVAHRNFIRIGMAIVAAWERREAGDPKPLEDLVRTLLITPEFQDEVLKFIAGPDLESLPTSSPLYPRALIAADKAEVSDVIANNDPEEIRYNVFQCLQYVADWLCGRGCVALPAIIGGEAVRVLDDLATAERSRWEVWLELYHGRFQVEDFLRIVFEEMYFIRNDLSNETKIVQVKFDARTAKWYPVAQKLMIRMMTASTPPEFITELLMVFTLPEVQAAEDPWAAAVAIDPALE